MGLLDFFTHDGKLKRHARRMADRDAQAEDRDASARWLATDASPKAIVGLLSRFDMNLTQQLKDTNEKDHVFNLLLNLGKDKLDEPLRHWLRQCKQFAFPLRLMDQLHGREAAVQMAFELLEVERSKSAFHPEKKKGLLVWLSDKRHPRALEVCAPFLGDFDEEVRCAAAEVLIAQESADARPLLLTAWTRKEEDSTRLRHRLADVFRARGWTLDGVDVARVLPNGFTVQDDRVR